MSARLADLRPWCAAFLLAAAACTFDTSGLGPAPADGGEPDAKADAGCATWPATNVDPCAAALPMPAPLALAGGAFTFDTDSGTLTPGTAAPPSALVEQPGGGELRVIVTSALTIAADAQLVAVGGRPLLVLVHGDARIDGVIDVAARSAPVSARRPGAGGNYADCGAGVGRDGGPVVASTGGGGGAGGGGFGADGDVGTIGAGRGRGNAGERGVANGSASLAPLRGGCAGGTGGIGIGPATGGPRGDGGGAVQIAARSRIIVSGQIRAGGAGGGGAAALRGGGGGGGAGGAIFLEGEHVELTTTAALCANGGAGGEGGDTGIGGLSGEDGTCSETVRARGGTSGNNAGNGGAGGNEAVRDGDPATSARGDGVGGGTTGGGGGGAGVGRVRIRGRASRAVPDAATVTPAAEL